MRINLTLEKEKLIYEPCVIRFNFLIPLFKRDVSNKSHVSKGHKKISLYEDDVLIRHVFFNHLD